MTCGRDEAGISKLKSKLAAKEEEVTNGALSPESR
jgi:hypothetical protein